MYFLLLTALLFSFDAFSQATDICDFIKMPNCRGVTKQLRRTSASSIPSTTTAMSMNPANVSFDRGVGLDMTAQPGNPLLFGLSTGTGKMGGALISGSIENSFFGNRAPEIAEVQAEREHSFKQYRNKKLAVALGARLINNKKASIDIGVIAKRHPEIKKINPGIGLSGRLWKISFGVSYYKDDYFIDLTKLTDPSTQLPYTEKSLSENFNVVTYTIGTRIGDLGIDYGVINTSKIDFYEDPTTISIFSASYHYNNFLLSGAIRQEHSQAPIIVNGLAEEEDDKSSVYAGLQYSINAHIIIGLQYNYFLLKEPSFSATFFL